PCETAALRNRSSWAPVHRFHALWRPKGQECSGPKPSIDAGRIKKDSQPFVAAGCLRRKTDDDLLRMPIHKAKYMPKPKSPLKTPLCHHNCLTFNDIFFMPLSEAGLDRWDGMSPAVQIYKRCPPSLRNN
ncbi:MAG: hypothetical protein WAM61_15640, partial [Desulfobacterales bacterium]